MTTPARNGIEIPKPVSLRTINGIQAILIGIGLLSANPLESTFAILQLVILVRAYWRQNTPPVVLLLFLIPWLEISTGILEANLRGQTLDEILHGSGSTSYWLSAAGLFAVHIGFYPFFKRSPVASFEQLKQAAKRFSFERLVIAYFAIGPASDLLVGFIGRGSSFYQFATYFNGISLAILIAICIRQVLLEQINRRFLLFTGVVVFLSFYSFFSEWRLVLFALIMGFGTLSSLSTRSIFRIAILGIVFGNIIFLWQGIKPVYRAYLTGQESLRGGLQTQAVIQSRGTSLAKFVELSGDFYRGELQAENFEVSDTQELLFSTLRRVGYLEFMCLTLNKVPEKIDHEKGTLLRSNLSFALIPRFLNPDKGVKDDGAKVEKYTGFMVAESASFSLGHYVEYFIDFGKSGMLIFLLCYGVIGGMVYRIVTQKSRLNVILMLGMLYSILQNWGSFQNDAIWIYGTTFFGFICHMLVFRPVYAAIEQFTMPANPKSAV
jgi:hypothetical protein